MKKRERDMGDKLVCDSEDTVFLVMLPVWGKRDITAVDLSRYPRAT